MGKKHRKHSEPGREELGTRTGHRPFGDQLGAWAIPACFVALIAVTVFSGGGFSYHVKVFKSFTTMLGVDLIALAAALYVLLKRESVRLPLLTGLYLVYMATALLPNLLTGQGYDTRFYVALHLLFLVLQVVQFNLLDQRGVRSILLVLLPLNFLICIFCFLEHFALLRWNGMIAHPATVVLTFGNQSYLSIYLIMMLPLTLAVACLDLGRIHRLFAVGTAFCLYLCCILTTQRNAFAFGLAVAVLFLFLFWLFFVRRDGWLRLPRWVLWTTPFGLGGVTAIFLSLNPWLLTRLLGSFSFQGLLGVRFLALKAAWDLFLQNPRSILIGNGLGSYYQMIFSVYDSDYRYYKAERSFKHVHNEYLEHLCEGGLLNTALFATIVGLTLWLLWRNFASRTENREGRVLALSLFCGIIGFLLDGLFQIATRMVSSQLVFAVLLGLSWVLIGQRLARQVRPTVVLPLAGAALVVATLFITHSFMSEYWHFDSLRYSYRSIVNQSGTLHARLAREKDAAKRLPLQRSLDRVTRLRGEMEASYQRGLEWNPRNIYLLYDQLLYEFMRGNFPAFDAVYQRIDKVIPGYRNIREVRALSFLHRKEYDKAKGQLLEYLSTDTYNVDALAALTVLDLLRGDPPAAATDLAEIFRRHLDMARYHTSFSKEYRFEGSGKERVLVLHAPGGQSDTGGTVVRPLAEILNRFPAARVESFYSLKNALRDEVGILLYEVGAIDYAMKEVFDKGTVDGGRARKVYRAHWDKEFDALYQRFQADPEDRTVLEKLIKATGKVRYRFPSDTDWRRFHADLYRRIGDYKRAVQKQGA